MSTKQCDRCGYVGDGQFFAALTESFLCAECKFVVFNDKSGPRVPPGDFGAPRNWCNDHQVAYYMHAGCPLCQKKAEVGVDRNPGSPRFLELLEKMRDIHIRKNAGYAGLDNPDFFANFRESEALGVSAVLGCLIRMGDKWRRVTNLVRDPSNEMVGEAITDTLIDLANYALIAICLLEEQSKVGLVPEPAATKQESPEILTTRYVDLDAFMRP